MHSVKIGPTEEGIMTINTVYYNPAIVRTRTHDQAGTMTATAADRITSNRRRTELKMTTYSVRFGLPARRK